MAPKTRPPPLKDVQIAAQADQSRHYLILDAHSPLPSSAYPFVQRDNPSWQVGSSVDTSNYRRDRALDSHDSNRSFTPPISPPALSPCGPDTEHSSKRSGRTFALVPAQADGKRVFTHVVVSPQDDDSEQHSPSHTVSPREVGFPEDMKDMLRQLDDLASWVKAASLSRDCTANPGDGLLLDKGKNRLLSTSPLSERNIRQDLLDSSRGMGLGSPTTISPVTNCRSEGFIYVPDCNTPEFLVGSSSSPIAYPVCGYSSHPSRYSPHSLDTTFDTYHRRVIERRSAPCPPPTSSFVSPPSTKASFKTLFHRSRCNTTTVTRPSIPLGHVPVENVLRQGKRMRLPWLRI